MYRSVLRALVVFLILLFVGAATGVAVWGALTFHSKPAVNVVDCHGLVTTGVLAAGVDVAPKQSIDGFCTLGQHWTIGYMRDGWLGNVSTLTIPSAKTMENCRQACLDPSVPCQAFSFDTQNNQCLLTMSGADPLLAFSNVLDNLKSSATETTALKLQIPFASVPPQCNSIIGNTPGQLDNTAPFMQDGPSNMCGVIGFGPSPVPPVVIPITTSTNVLDFAGCSESCVLDPTCNLSSRDIHGICTTFKWGTSGPNHGLDNGLIGKSVFYKV